MSSYGIVEYYGCNVDPYPCGYCKNIKPADYGMWSHRLSNMSYQNLIDRNWRRSGQYCYKPILNKTCCPMYTIRCDALDFKLKKSHKKVIKRFNHFIINDQKPEKRHESGLSSIGVTEEKHNIEPLMDKKETKDLKIKINSNTLSLMVPITSNNDTSDVNVKCCDQRSDINSSERKKRKAKYIRKERKLQKIMKIEKCDQLKGQQIMNERHKKRVIETNKNKSLEDYLNETEIALNAKHKLQIKFISTLNDEYKDTLEASHSVYSKYQMAIHGDSVDKCTQRQYKRFLIDSPLEIKEFNNDVSNELPKHYGSYHQQYWLDNKLIAVGVIDVLPYCVSSVYLYYDPDFNYLSLGTYSALREIALVRKLQRFLPQLKYYYMGFYIHSCPKMRYKGQFLPSDLLCPETHTWHPITKCALKLDIIKYCRFEDNPNVSDDDSNAITDSDIKVLYNRTDMSFRYYKSNSKVSENEEQLVKEYAKLIGKKCCHQILLYRQ